MDEPRSKWRISVRTALGVTAGICALAAMIRSALLLNSGMLLIVSIAAAVAMVAASVSGLRKRNPLKAAALSLVGAVAFVVLWILAYEFTLGLR